jgi:hypothetical protein
MITMKHLKGAMLLFATFALFTRCSDDDGNNVGQTGTIQFQITDAPIDDADIQGVFVTVTAVKVDGETISGFSGKQTIDLMAYQSGNVKLLGTAELEEGTYDDVSLVLDLDSDANGGSPGSYVLTNDNVKHSLKAGSDATMEIEVESGNFTVEEGGTANVVIDFDLRKALRYDDAPSANDSYDFVTKGELEASLRMVNQANTGTISGTAQDNLGVAGDLIVVYAYEKGSFNKETEINGQGESDIQFKNAVTSAVVNGQGNYKLSFLKEGDYELHFFGYEDTDNDGDMELTGELDLDLIAGIGLDLNNISVDANSTVTLSVLIKGLLP